MARNIFGTTSLDDPNAMFGRSIVIVDTRSSKARGGKGGSGAGGGAVFPAFAPEAETTLLAASFSTPPTDKRLRTMNRTIKRMKEILPGETESIWDKTISMMMPNADEDSFLTDWKDPSNKYTKLGTPSFVADSYFEALATGDAIDTHMVVDNMPALGEAHMWVRNILLSNKTDWGAVNGSSIGISQVLSNTSAFSTGRWKSASVTIQGTNKNDSEFLCGMKMLTAGTISGFHNGVQLDDRAITPSASAVPQSIYLLSINNNGSPGTNFSNRQQASFWIGEQLSEAQTRELAGCIGEYIEYLDWGEVDLHDSGSGEATITVDALAYGTTLGSIAFAIAAKREGASVAICGGWRDRHFGGTSGGGLGKTDFENQAGLGGLPRWVITRMNEIKGIPDTTFNFEPRYCRWVLLELLDQYDIPVYWSDGVDTVTEAVDGRITSIKTVDGRTFVANQFHDGSYEGDIILRHSNVGYDTGREDNSALGESTLGGYRGVILDDSASIQQFKIPGTSTMVWVDPWVTPGDTGSGLVAGINGIYSTFTPGLHNQPAVGSADDAIQAYNFRLTMTSNVTIPKDKRRIPLPTVAPPDYDKAKYELLLRYLDEQPTATIADDIIFPREISTTIYDFNARGGQSTDYFTANWNYPLASYAQREAIWKDHWNFTLGWWYLLQHDTSEARVPSALRTEALTWGFVRDHYYHRHENDETFIMPQMYVRETIRMHGIVKMVAGDFTMADGTPPAHGTNIIGVASYPLDSHSTQLLAYEESAGNWGIWQEGNFFGNMGGTDEIAPIPIEACIPPKVDCPNLSASFCVSMTHACFGSYRMEFASMMIGYSLGVAAAMAGATAVQDVDYPTLRATLLASPELVGENPPVLPQVN